MLVAKYFGLVLYVDDLVNKSVVSAHTRQPIQNNDYNDVSMNIATCPAVLQLMKNMMHRTAPTVLLPESLMWEHPVEE